jgi:hypothetical protein
LLRTELLLPPAIALADDFPNVVDNSSVEDIGGSINVIKALLIWNQKIIGKSRIRAGWGPNHKAAWIEKVKTTYFGLHTGGRMRVDEKGP